MSTNRRIIPSAVTTPPDLVTPPLAVNRDPVSKAHASSSQNNSDWEKAHPPSENPSRAIKKPGFTRVVELKRNPDPDQSGKLLYFLRRQRNVTKGELADELDVPLRDLRTLTLSGNMRLATVLVRRKAILLRMDPLQAIITPDRVKFFNLNAPETQGLLTAFWLGMVKGGPTVPVLEAPKPLSIKERDGGRPVPSTTYFELRALERLLVWQVELLEAEFTRVARPMSQLLDELLTKQGASELQSLLALRQRLVDCRERVEEVYKAIAELLNSDEDMSHMYLTDRHNGLIRQENDHEEVEALLEAFSHSVTELDNRIKSLLNRADRIEAFIRIHFDSQRNRLIRINLLVSCASLSVATAGAGASFFGMNLLSGLEQHPMAFFAVSGALGTLASGIYMFTYLYYRRSKGAVLAAKRALK